MMSPLYRNISARIVPEVKEESLQFFLDFARLG
jgi:hypothetical protein